LKIIIYFIILFSFLYNTIKANEQLPLRIGVAAFPSSDGDPHRSVSVYTTYIWSPIFETLTTFKENGELIGELAESWKQIEPNIWHFFLKKNITFSNGRPLKANDILESLNYIKTSHGSMTIVARDLSVIKSSHVINDHTIAIKTSIPSAILPRILTALYIVEPDHWKELGPEDFAKNPIGSGSYKVSSWEQGVISYIDNKYSNRLPKIKKLKIFQLPESTTRLQALISGSIDIAIGMSPDDINPIETIGGYMHQRKPIDVMTITFVIGEGKPIDDVRVRRALNYAVNKEAITKILLSGYSQPATQGAVRGLLGYNSDLQTYPYNPKKARILLNEAGYKDGFTLNIEVIIGSNASDSAIYQLVASNLKDVGVSLKINPIPTSQMVKVILQGQWKGDGFSQIFGGWPTFEPMKTFRFHSCLSPTPWFCDKTIMPKIKATIESPSLNNRIRLTKEVLAFYHDQATTLMLHEVPLLDGIGPRIMSYSPNKGKINYESLNIRIKDKYN
jgi:peptide/nickel transport system substrate-binding protein